MNADLYSMPVAYGSNTPEASWRSQLKVVCRSHWLDHENASMV